MQTKPTQDMLGHIQGGFELQIGPPRQTLRARVSGRLNALQALENREGFLQACACSGNQTPRAEWKTFMRPDPKSVSR